MTRLIRKATIMTVWGLLVAGAALAAVPTSDSQLPTNPVTGRNAVYLGSYTSYPSPGLRPSIVGPGPLYQFTITVKSSPTQVVPFSTVKIDFSACKKLYIAANNADPPTNCATNTYRVVANGSGVASFAIVGESDNPSGAANPEGFESTTQGCAAVWADNGFGVYGPNPIGYLFIGTPNEDHSSSGGAVTGADLSALIGDVAFVASPAATCSPNCFLNRSDFDQDGAVGGADISKMVDIIVAVAAYNGPGCDPLAANNCCLPRIN